MAPTNTPNIGRRGYEKGLLTFVWRAEDDNRDELTYDVFYRREGDTTWRVLKTDLRDTYPFGLFASPMEEIVRSQLIRMPSSSASTASSSWAGIWSRVRR